MPCTRGLLQPVQVFIESHYSTRHFTSTSRQSQENIIIEAGLNKCLVYIKMTLIQITFTKRRTQERDTVRANISPKSIPSRCWKPRATSLNLAFTTHPCSSTFQVYTHLASITLSTGCYTGANVPACKRPWNSLFMECRHMFACGEVSASITFTGVGRSDARAVGRSGEAPCSCMISCIASPLSNIETRAA